ncbi:GLUT4 regulating protein TUG-domain-containing protein [Hyaloraphidium curvatum]|nr:GLUT4 regulating protein TUG-domain-containing protein [Hyaloraphidium curvatum]
MSAVNIVLPDNRKLMIKTTPTMSLAQVLAQACEKGKVEPAGYGLKHNKTVLDLSLSMRFANLAPGAKLELVRVSTSQASASAEVAVALQLEEGRFVGKFKSSTTLWNVLRHFETQETNPINLTRREAVPPADSSNPLLKALKSFADKRTPVYMMPVLIVMNNEFSSIPTLHDTTLAAAGLSSGSGLIRVLFRHSDITLNEALMQAIECARKAPQAGPEPARAPGSSPATAHTAATPLVDAGSAGQASPVGGPSDISASAAPAPSATEMRKPDDLPREPLQSVEGPGSGGQLPPDSEPAAAEADDGGPLDRNVSLFQPPPAGEGAASIELPDSFFELSQAELKLLLAQSRRQTEKLLNRPLMTKELRDQEKAKELQLRKTKYPKTRIRVRFPDMVSLEATFWSEEPVSELYSVISSVLQDAKREFHLTTPGLSKKELDPAASFVASGMAPACNVHLSWKIPGGTVVYLSSEAAKQLKPHPRTASAPVVGAEDMSVDEKAPAARPTPAVAAAEKKTEDGSGKEKGAKMPAWLMRGLKK